MKVLISESAYNVITENVIYMKQSEIPMQIVQWAKEKIGNIKLWKVRQKGQIAISGAWHEQTINYYGVFQLVNGNYIKTREFRISGKEAVTPSETINIPSGFLVVILDTYTNSADIYTSSDALKMLPDTTKSEGLSDEQMMALIEAKQLKAHARFKFKDDVYAELISRKLMAQNRSITIEGRNLVESLSRAEKQEIANRLNETYSKAPYYKRFYAY